MIGLVEEKVHLRDMIHLKEVSYTFPACEVAGDPEAALCDTVPHLGGGGGAPWWRNSGCGGGLWWWWSSLGGALRWCV